ncbi:MAG: hypothetical protein ACJ764_05030 [Solirubrobacteraceae bacterium]
MLSRGALTLTAAFLLWGMGITPLTQADKLPLTPTVSLTATPSSVRAGHAVVLSGRVQGVLTSTRVKLYSRPYPYRKATLVGTRRTASDGSFSFTEQPGRNVRYRVYVKHPAVHAMASVAVRGRVKIREQPIPLGRAKVVIVLYHPRDLQWRNGRVQWWFAPKGQSFASSPTTGVRRLSQTKIELVTKATLPAGRYRWRACFHAPSDRALTDRNHFKGCTGQAYGGHARLPQGFPGPRAIARAEHYLASRGGHTALAVVDSEGRMSGVNIDDQFITGSVVKAMLLVAYLRRLDRMGQHSVDSYSNSFLYPMIHVSDNNAATHCWSIVGNSGLYEVAHAAGMTHFSVDTNASWGSEWGAALLTAHDQARFFFYMDSLIPDEFVGYARYLLSHIADYESWGIPHVARPAGYDVFFKAGWRPSPDVFLVHQIARLEKGHERFSLAVMTDGDPDMGYGIQTIQSTTYALLHRR